MEIGNQIKQLRLRRGITQEEMAQHFGITPQAVSKWERDVTTPDIGLLPDISAYFGVTIDELFALSDDTKMKRIQNMLWDVRYISLADADSAREFLLDKARREKRNGEPYALLAQLENQLANTHKEAAAEYAKKALQRDHSIRMAHSELAAAMNGKCGDWCADNHNELIEYYKGFTAEHPDNLTGYLWLIDQLLADYRIEEAEACFAQIEKLDNGYRTPYYRAILQLEKGNVDAAMAIFEEMESAFPEEWIMYLSLGDAMTRIGKYEKAKAYYRKYQDNQKDSPKYTDGLTSIAQICEIQGDYAGAIAAIEEEIATLAAEWSTTSGEMVDQHLRKIEKLKKLL